MSFLEQPYILPIRSLPNQDPVNFNLFASFQKFDKDEYKTNGGAKDVEFQIVWVPSGAMQSGQSIIWRYSDKECRDSDYSDLIAKISLPLGSE